MLTTDTIHPMTTNAIPKKIRRPYSRATLYPAQISVVMTEEQRAAIDALVETSERSLGFVVRDLLQIGLDVHDLDQ